jgi:hypothetical protein
VNCPAEEDAVFAVIALIIFAVGFVLQLAGASLGRMDGLAFLLLGAVFMAAHAAFAWYPWRNPPRP